MKKAIRKRTKKVGARGAVHVSRSVKSSGEADEHVSETSKEIQTGVNHPNPAYVRVDGGLTKNLGDYNSAKVGVSVSMPCEPNEKSVRKCYEKTSKLVDEFMDEEFKNAVGEED